MQYSIESRIFQLKNKKCFKNRKNRQQKKQTANTAIPHFFEYNRFRWYLWAIISIKEKKGHCCWNYWMKIYKMGSGE